MASPVSWRADHGLWPNASSCWVYGDRWRRSPYPHTPDASVLLLGALGPISRRGESERRPAGSTIPIRYEACCFT